MAAASSVPSRGVALDLYADRSLLMARPGDLVCLHVPPELSYLEYLQDLGIGPHTRDILVCPDLEPLSKLPLPVKLVRDAATWDRLTTQLSQCQHLTIQPYITTRFEQQLAESLQQYLSGNVLLMGGNSELIEHFDQKQHVRALAQELQLPIAPGEAVDVAQGAGWMELSRAIATHMQSTGKVIVRGASGNAGSSVAVIHHAHEIESTAEQLQQRDNNHVYLVEAMLNVVSSPNIGMYIDPHTREIYCYSCTEQQLNDRMEHLGNSYPLRNGLLSQMIADATKFTAHLRDGGVTGHVGFDFCEHTSAVGRSSYIFAELNPRLNGATYSQALFDTLQLVQVGSGGLPLTTYFCTFGVVQQSNYAAVERAVSDLLFTPGADMGLLPMYLAYLPQGQCGFMLVANHAEGLAELHARLMERVAPSAERHATLAA